MNTLSVIKRRMKKFVVPAVAVPAAVLASASSAFATIDYTAVQTLITAAVADIVAGGLIILGALAGYWGIKRVMTLFGGK